MHISKAVISGIVLAAISAGALAQQGVLEEVIVTATKRAASLQDIPVSVNALSSSTIQEAGIGDIGDVAALVPSLSVTTNLSPFATSINIRGFGTSQNDPSLEASVAFILDGVYMGNSGLGMSDLTDIDRIEVLQGPQGTLYGKNSNAGVVSVITKSPNTEETEGFLEATVGDYSLRKYVASVTGPITDSLAYLVSGSWNESDGWLENDSGDDLNAVEDWNLRGKLLWEPTNELSVQLTASHVDRDTSCCGADATHTTAVTDELQAQGLPVPKNDGFDYNNNVGLESNFDLSADSINITADYELSSATLTSITAWNQYDYLTSFDGDRSDLFVIHVIDDKYTGELWSQELRLTSDLDGPLQYIAGLYYSSEERTRGGPNRNTIFIGDDIVAVGGAHTGFGPVFGFGAQPGDSVAFDNTWNAEAVALFGQTTYNLSDDLVMTLGLRYTSETKEADLTTQLTSTAVLFGTGQTLIEQAFGSVDDDFDEDFGGFTGLANISYFMNEDIMLFASVSTGTKSGGFNGVAVDRESRDFGEEETTNYELGIKSQLLDSTLQLNVTAFYMEFDDLQFLAQLDNGVGFFVSNAAKGTSTGVDLSFTAVPWEFLTLSGGLQYLDAKYTEGELKDAGFEVTQAPDWTGSLSATFLMPLAEGMTYLRGDYSFMGDHFNNPTFQEPRLEQDKELVNVRLGWRNANWDAAIYVNNATDETYSSVSSTPLGFSGTEAQFLEAPRTYGATLRYNF